MARERETLEWHETHAMEARVLDVIRSQKGHHRRASP